MGIGKNSFIGLATDLTVFGLGFVLSIILRRILGVDLSGVYALLTLTNVLLANLAGLSVGLAATTILAREEYRLGDVNGVAMMLALLLGGSGALVTALLFPLLHDNIFRDVDFSLLLVVLLLVPTTIYQVYWSAMMVGQNRIVLMNKVHLGQNLGSAGALVLAAVFGGDVLTFLAAWAGGQLGGALIMLIVAWRLDKPAFPKPALLRQMLGFGLRGHGSNVVHNLILRFDVYLIKALLDNAAVGAYTLSTSLAERMWVLTGAINAGSRSTIAKLSPADSALITAKVLRTTFLFALAVAIPFAAVSPWLIPFLYTEEFAPSVVPLMILLAGTIFLAMMLILNNYIIGQMQRPGLLSAISWAQLLVSLPAYLILIPLYGIVGAAIASSFAYFVALSANLILFLRHSGLPLSLVFIPQPGDFQDYARVLRSLFARVRRVTSDE